MRAEQTRAAERRRRLLLAGAAIGVVLLLIVGLVVAKAVGLGDGDSDSPDDSPAATGSDRASAAVVNDVTAVPAATLDAVGFGTAQAAPTRIDAPPLTADGKPQVLYVGAEYCPFCAAERWPFVVAMTRFGQFANLQATASGAAPEAYPNTATLSFHGPSYTSQYLGFTGVETQTNTNQPLDTLSGDNKAIFDTYNPGGSIPFIDYGGKATATGASVDPSIFAGKTQAQIADDIANPSTTISKAVLGSANVITAQLCALTNNQPAPVCTSSGVTTAAAALK